MTRFSVQTATGEPVAAPSPVALSPDGRLLVYNVGLNDMESGSRLYLHSLDSFTPRELEGTDGPAVPFFSPTGDSVGFFSRPSGLRQLRLDGGAPTPLADDIRDLYGASWHEGGHVVFSPAWGAPLSHLSLEDGSGVSTLTTVNTVAGEAGHLWPQILPGGQSVLFSVWNAADSWDEASLAVADLETGQHSVIYQGGASGWYAASGHLVFWRGGDLMAAPFDLGTREVGDAVTVVEHVRLNNGNGRAHFALSETGTLAFVSGGIDSFAETLVLDRSGQEVLRLDETQPVGDPRFSPDGTKVAVTLLQQGTYHIGVYDLSRDVLNRITFADDNLRPIWTPDGDRLTYLSNADGAYNYYTTNADGSGNPERLLPTGIEFSLSDPAWSPDGEHLVYMVSSEDTGWDLWTVSPNQESEPRPLLASPSDESDPYFSPDGQYIVFQSAQSGTVDIQIRPFPSVDDQMWPVSRAGGRAPVWSGDGREILYVTDEGLESVPVLRDSNGSLSLGRPSPVLGLPGLNNFDLSPSGDVLAVYRVPVEGAATEIRIVQNWHEELKRLVPVN